MVSDLNSPNKINLSTIQFCRSSRDGLISPNWNDSREQELAGAFEEGLVVGERYFIKQVLGDGAMGRVFLATDVRLERPVAMKVVSYSGRNFADLEAALEREARLGANLNHSGIASVFDFGFHEDKSYTIFEYVEGETLREVLSRRGKFTLEETQQVVHELAFALDFAHLRGVVHRDLKPENICFSKSGELKILDFGMAWDTSQDIASGSYSGTPAYSSPEQAKCRPTDGKSDQYALALIVYEMLTGRMAFQADNPHQLLQKQISEPAPTPSEFVADLPEEVENAILRSLRKTPDDRFATCQEFARAISVGNVVQGRLHVATSAEEDRIGFYISHIADESLLARQIARDLERRQYACWYYGRDAIAGIPFGKQFRSAINRSEAFVLLISRQSLYTGDLERELEHAHGIGCPILPLLVDISREEFENLAPSWCRMLGQSPLVEYRRAQELSELIERLKASADGLSLSKNNELQIQSTGALHSYPGQTWATDANQIDILELEHVLYRNDAIDDFLRRKQRYFISATKGFGKTLLLTFKRHLLTQSPGSSGALATMVPEGRPFLDFMSEMRSLSNNYEAPLSEITNTKRLWNAALRISAISHYPNLIEDYEQVELETFPSRIQRWLQGSKIQPTVAFKELTMLRVSELNRLIDQTENFLDQKMRQIHHGTLFFIDKVDQAIHHMGRDAWIAVQAGLIEAAWETMNANSHLKVYASIRQEAFTNYESDIKSNLFSSTTTLDYSDDELQELLNKLASCYEGSASFAEFIGFNVIRHGRRPAPEDSFQYVRRHTCGRPRDLVAIASEISSKRSSINEKRFREVVRQTTSNVLVSNIFDEVRVFMNCLGEREDRLRFLDQLPQNVLERTDAVRACEVFNGLEPGSLAVFGEDSSEIFHPFRDLYLAGMLGVLVTDPESGLVYQRFRKPHDSIAHDATELPESDIYLVHPALDTYIRAQRSRSPFLQFQHIQVGENLLWRHYFPTLIQIEKQLQQVSDREFVDRSHRVVKRIQALLNTETPPFARVEIETSSDWKWIVEHNKTEPVEETHIWLESMLEEL